MNIKEQVERIRDLQARSRDPESSPPIVRTEPDMPGVGSLADRRSRLMDRLAAKPEKLEKPNHQTKSERSQELEKKLQGKKAKLAEENPPQDRQAEVDFDIDAMFGKMLDSIAEQRQPGEYDLEIVADRLNSCRSCDGLRSDGCAYCPSCSSRWTAWQDRLIQGICPRFTQFIISTTPQPVMKVNEMHVYNYSVSYTLPADVDPAKRLVLAGVIAESLPAAIDAVSELIPEALVIDARAMHPISVISRSVVNGEVQYVSEPPRMEQTPQGMPMAFSPPGMSMMGRQ